jgi:hypothetical protein
MFESLRIEQQREIWLRSRANGKVRFVWSRAILSGAFLLTIASFGKLLFYPRVFGWDTPVILAIAIAAGYVFGSWSWNRLENRFNQSSPRR